MSAKIVCPDCHAVFEPGGRNCPRCNAPVHTFAAAEPPAIEPLAEKPPLPRARPVVARRAPKDDADDDPRPSRRRQRRDDDDDRRRRDDNDPPRRRKKAGNGRALAIILGGLGLLALVLVGLGFALWPSSRPADVPVVEFEPKLVQQARMAEGGRPLVQVPGFQVRGAVEEEPLAPPPAAEPPKPPPAEPFKLPPVVPLPFKVEHAVTDRQTFDLPGEVSAVCVGGGGRFLCFHFAGLRQVGVFDTATAKIAKYLPVTGDNVLIAAGMDRLIVHDRTANVFVRWNLRTFEKEATLPNPTKMAVGRMLMGGASNGPLVLAARADANPARPGDAAFVDPISLKPFAVQKPPAAGGVNALTGHLSEDGRLLVGPTDWHDDYYFARVGPTLDVKKVQFHPNGELRPAADGRLVYANGGTYGPTGAVLGHPAEGPSTIVEPSLHGGLAVRAFRVGRPDPGVQTPDADTEADLKFYLDGRPAPVLTWARQTVPLPNGIRFGPVPGPARRLFLVPDAKLFVALSGGNNKLFLRRFDLAEELEKSGVDYLLVTSRPPAAVPGRPFVYPIVVKSRKGGVKFKLESGPEGMALSADGKLTWAVPADAAPASVLLTVSDATGQEVFHNFTLEPTAAVAVAPAPAVVVMPPSGTKRPNPPMVVIAGGKEAVVPVPTKVFPITPTAAADGTEVKLPGPAAIACLAGGGRFLLLTLPSANQIAVLDLCLGKVVKYLTAAEEWPLIAGGMTKFFVLYRTANVIQRYDLGTFEKEQTAANPVDAGAAGGLLMGHASDGPLLAVARDPDGRGGKYGFVDARSLRPLAVRPGGPGQGIAGLGEGPVRPSADGRVYGFWRGSGTPTGLSCLVLNDDGTSTTYYEHTSVGPVLPGPDGTLYTGRGLYTPQLKLIGPGGQPWGVSRVPAAAGPFYLEANMDVNGRPVAAGQKAVPRGAVSVLMADDRTPLVTLDKVAGYRVPDDWHPARDTGLSDRLFLVPAAHVLAVLNDARTAVCLTRLNLRDVLPADRLVVLGKPGGAARGKTFVYAPEVWSKAGGVAFKLESGPAGMTATATGVAWDVPKDAAAGTVDVILAVSNAAGTETFHTFKLAVTE